MVISLVQVFTADLSEARNVARIRIIEIEGDAAELAGIDIERLLKDHAAVRTDGGHVAGGQEQKSAIPSEIRKYIERKANQREHDFFIRFVSTVLGWNAVRAELSAGIGRDGDPRSVVVRRLPQHKGAFALVNPRLGRVTFRLPSSAAAQSPVAVAVPAGRMYGVRIPLTSEEALDAALELAQQAYAGAVRAT